MSVRGKLASIGMPWLVCAGLDFQALAGAVRQYATDHDGRFPDSLEALVTPNERGQTDLDLDHCPRDPWDREYLYEPPAPGTNRFRVLSYGADGVPGGEGEDADIENEPR